MKKLILILPVLVIAGCVTASPIDLLVPARRPVLAQDYMGHLFLDKPANFMYYSLTDLKANKALLPVRKKELEAAYYVVKGELDVTIAPLNMVSNVAWAAITMALASAGIMIPKPGTSARIQTAGLQDPDEFKKA